jgi:agmatinase
MSNKEEKINTFNPNSAGVAESQMFGLPFTIDESDIVLLPVPWEVTVSYGGGASEGPEHIFESSLQVDLHHPEFPELWKKGIAMLEQNGSLHSRSNSLKEKAEEIISAWEEGESIEEDDELKEVLQEINEGCADMVQYVANQTKKWLDAGKTVGLIGGDHSTPLGYLQTLSERYENFGILHIDAHMDLREAYEGFTYSHASIMYNAMQIPQITKLVQVGIRDFCKEENDRVENSKGRIIVHTDAEIQRAAFEGVLWKERCNAIIDALPKDVYISFDIDGLDPTLCPNTGTPVPGGLSFQQALYLLSQLKAKKNIIGFDLVEVAPGEDDWNGNVGARLLYHMCGVAS